MKDGEATKVEYDGRTYELTEEQAQVGDLLYNIEGFGRAQLAEEYYEVIEVDEFARVEDEDGENNGWRHEEQGEMFKIFRNMSEDLEGRVSSLESRVDEVENKQSSIYTDRMVWEIDTTVEKEDIGLDKGDIVYLSIDEGETPEYGWGDVSNGDIGVVTHKKLEEVVVEFPEHYNWNGKVDELVKLKEGDKVKLDADDDEDDYPLYGFNNGGTYEVADLCPVHITSGVIEIKREPGKAHGYALPSQIVKVMDVAVKDIDIEVGGLYKVSGNTLFDDIKEGNVVKVASNEDSDGEVRIVSLGGGDYDYIKPDLLTEITPKEGDIVRVLPKRLLGSRNEPGDIGVVTGVNDLGYYVDVENESALILHHAVESLEIVALKEHRLDA